jgi:tetratricopeptide (TPR) repeat protein
MSSQKKSLFRSDSPDESQAVDSATQGKPMRARLATMLGRWIEILVLVLVAVSPWLFGGVEPVHEWWLFSVVALALLLWGIRVLLEGGVRWRPCWVTLCTLAIVYIGFAQLLPLPAKVLGALSPATARTFEFLLPEHPEALRPDLGDFASQEIPSHPLTFYQTATAQTICHLLAALALFALVRNNLPAKQGLLRLSIVALVNGAALSLLAILQMFSSPPNEIYWTYKAPAVVFGPFICRNHFPFYINCCLGLGVGLLIYSQSPKHSYDSSSNGTAHSRHRRHRTNGRSSHHNPNPIARGSEESFLKAETLWIGSGLALMLCAVVLSLSRGGVVVLFAVTLLGFLVWGRSLFRLSRSAIGLSIGAAGALALLSWFGMSVVKDRLETLWQSGGLEARTPLWSACLPLMGQFPFFGTGYGTFPFVEPLHRAYVSEEFSQLIFAHAHNEFIEAMVEGGILRLVLSLAAIGFVFAAGYRVLRNRTGPAGGLVAGALFAFTTVVLHGIGDFGMHVPAIVILVAVLAAYIVGAADDLRDSAAQAEGREAPTARMIRWGGLAPLLAAGVFTGTGLLLFAQSYHWQLVHRFLMAGVNRGTNPDLPQLERRIEYLKTAVALGPTYATTEMELAQAYYEAYSGQQNRLVELQTANDFVTSFVALRCLNGSPLALVEFAAETIPTEARWRGYIVAREADLGKAYLAPALRYFITARDLCPLLGKPHARIATHRDLLARGDTSEQYMERVHYLRKYDPEVWYITGMLELAVGQTEMAWQSWRRSLELSDLFLMDIVNRSLAVLPDDDDATDKLIDSILPDNPSQLFRVAMELYPTPADQSEREPYIDRALGLLKRPEHELTAPEAILKAKLLYAAGRRVEAMAAFKVAIEYNPSLVHVRIDYAKLLYELQFVPEARWEVLKILDNDPTDSSARDLLTTFERAAANK